MKLKVDIPPGVQARIWLADEKKWAEVTSGRHQWPK
jgi:hypothetical protein